MKIILKHMLVAGFNRGFLREGFVVWCFIKFDLRSV
ncbi:Uncharacterised protein [Klebsiella pneumoniae]|uniref:Uncharacterized protein n=1 Tax=Klebsiella pneumoniae TaxID=573 RepID=A0A2X3IP65_KLEPN|nr:Uncharacterised protein [Klebsiella pneumoniae]